jgi:hypothetical protein
MTITLRALLLACAAAIAVPGSSALAQSSQRGQPQTPFAAADFAKLGWLEGSWAGTSPGETNIYQRFHMANDSTLEISYYGDPEFSRNTGTGRIYLSIGRVYHTFGAARWGASHIDANGVFFVPQVNVRNTFAWTVQSPDSWTSTLRSGVSGHERVTVYQMQRVKR